MAHAKGVIDRLRLRIREPSRQYIEVDIVWMNQRLELAESEQFVLCRQSEHVEHRMRPENTAARQIPVPQAAAAAIERGINAAAHRIVDQIRFSGAGGLPMKSKTENENDEACRRRKGNGQRRGRTPGYQRCRSRSRRRRAAPADCATAVPRRRRRFRWASVTSTVPALPRTSDGLADAENIKDRPAELLRIGRDAADDGAFGIGDEDRDIGVRPRR